MRSNLKRLRVVAEVRKSLDTQQFAVAIINLATTRLTATREEITESSAQSRDVDGAK